MQKTKQKEALQSSIGNCLSEKDSVLAFLFQKKKNMPQLTIPKFFSQFVQTPQFFEFTDLLYVYCCQFHKLNVEHTNLIEKMRMKLNCQILMKKQKQKLVKLEKELSFKYGVIILKVNEKYKANRKIRTNLQDQLFFETLIYFLEKVMRQQFHWNNFVPIKQEINRLFRSNRYNITKKRLEEDDLLEKYPHLKDPKPRKNLTVNAFLNKAQYQINDFRKSEKYKKFHKTQTTAEKLIDFPEIKEMGIEERSPLISTWLPSGKLMKTGMKRSKRRMQIASLDKKSLRTINGEERKKENEIEEMIYFRRY